LQCIGCKKAVLSPLLMLARAGAHTAASFG